MTCTALLSILTAFAVAQDAPRALDSLMRAAPADCDLVLVCDDVPGLLAGLHAGPLGALWADAALAAWRAQFAAQLSEHWEQASFPGGPELGELARGVRSGACFLGGFSGDEVGVGACVVTLDDELGREIAAWLAADGSDAERVRVEGRAYLVERTDAGEWTVAGEWLEGLVFGFGQERERALEWAHGVVVALEAEPGRLTPRGAEFSARRLSPHAVLELQADVGALMRAVLADAEAEAADAASAGPLEPREIFERLGLTGLGWASLSLALADDGAFDVRSTFEVPASGLVGRMLAMTRRAPLGLGRFAPRGTISAQFLGLDTDELWRVTQELVGEFDVSAPAADGSAHSGLLERRLDEVEALIGVDLREAVFENLTGDFAALVLPAATAYAEAPEAPLAALDAFLAHLGAFVPQVGAVHVVGLRDGSAMEDLIDGLIGLAGADALIVEEQVGEHWMQSIDASRLPIPGIAPCWVVLEDALLVSGGRASLRAALARTNVDPPAGWLDQDPRAQRALALAAGGACFVAVADQAQLFERRVLQPLREFDAALESEAYASLLRPLLASVNEDAFERMRGYLGEAIGAGERLRTSLAGDWFTTVTYVDGRFAYHTWNEPAD